MEVSLRRETFLLVPRHMFKPSADRSGDLKPPVFANLFNTVHHIELFVGS